MTTGAERPRILIDVTASWHEAAGEDAAEAARAEREIALRLLADATLLTLPVVFAADRIHALDAADVTTRLKSAPLPVAPAPGRTRAAAATTPTGRARWKAAVARTGLRVARWGATTLYRLTPQRAQGELLEVFRHGKRVASTLLRPAAAMPARASAVDAARLASLPIVYPSRGDLVWSARPLSGLVPLRRLAEERQRHGFAVATLCTSVDATSLDTIDLLDAADVIFCTSDQAMADLRALAAASGRSVASLRRTGWGASGAWDEVTDRLRAALVDVAGRGGLA